MHNDVCHAHESYIRLEGLLLQRLLQAKDGGCSWIVVDRPDQFERMILFERMMLAEFNRT